MTRILTFFKCDKCGEEYKNLYVSFGHPANDFKWKWKCDDCGYVNEILIEAMHEPKHINNI